MNSGRGDVSRADRCSQLPDYVAFPAYFFGSIVIFSGASSPRLGVALGARQVDARGGYLMDGVAPDAGWATLDEGGTTTLICMACGDGKGSLGQRVVELRGLSDEGIQARKFIHAMSCPRRIAWSTGLQTAPAAAGVDSAAASGSGDAELPPRARMGSRRAAPKRRRLPSDDTGSDMVRNRTTSPPRTRRRTEDLSGWGSAGASGWASKGTSGASNGGWGQRVSTFRREYDMEESRLAARASEPANSRRQSRGRGQRRTRGAEVSPPESLPRGDRRGRRRGGRGFRRAQTQFPRRRKVNAPGNTRILSEHVMRGEAGEILLRSEYQQRVEADEARALENLQQLMQKDRACHGRSSSNVAAATQQLPSLPEDLKCGRDAALDHASSSRVRVKQEPVSVSSGDGGQKPDPATALPSTSYRDAFASIIAKQEPSSSSAATSPPLLEPGWPPPSLSEATRPTEE